MPHEVRPSPVLWAELLPEQIAQDELAHQVTLEIHGRSSDPIKTLEVLRHIFPQLIPHIADSVFLVELERYLPKLPDHFRVHFLNILYRTALPLPAKHRVTLLKEMMRKVSKFQFPEEQLPGDD